MLHLLWQKVRKHLIIITGIILILLALIAFIFLVHRLGWDWTGFNGGYRKTTTTNTTHGITTTTEEPLTKTLWDWLQLLIIPLVLAVGGLWFSQVQKDREQKAAEQRAQTEREIAGDNQQEATLQEYINKMSELLLVEELCKPTAKEEARKIARVRTLTVIPRLNGRRQGIVLQFLYEAQLINKGETVVDLSRVTLIRADLSGAGLSGAMLSEADLRKANLTGTNLTETDLSKANLREANLSGVILIRADLSFANLRGADLSFANLSKANLSKADLTAAWPGGWKRIYTNLSKANLSGADLTNAGLTEANLTGADLSQANLKDAKGITIEELEKQAKSLKGAIMPDGSIHT